MQEVTISRIRLLQKNEKCQNKPWAYLILKVKFSGNDPGNAHQIPSVSSSSGLPIFSISNLAFWIIFAPVYVTTPAISMEYHRAPLQKLTVLVSI